MFDSQKSNKVPDVSPVDTTGLANQVKNKAESAGFFSRLKQGLSKTRATFTTGMAHLFLGKKVLDKDLLNNLETQLLTADLGVETTEQLIQTLTQKLARNELNDAQVALQYLQNEMKHLLQPCNIPLSIPVGTKPYVIVVVGINGSGKTTTIGKLANYLKQQRKSVMLAAGDTFRAAAIEQLQSWGAKNQTPVIAQQPGADTAAVLYDALEAAKARGMDVLIADTAGRLHTQSNLMAELQKVKRVLAKIDPTAPHETLLVIDATLGQNVLNQVKQFNESIGISGIVLTKLDGTAKGGIIFAVAEQNKIPIRFIGVGESITDLRPFQADEFVDALFKE
jgi:fused signal recognition particle receptor